MRIKPKFFYNFREINWIEPEEFFYKQHYTKISFFINNPAEHFPDGNEWCYVSCGINNSTALQTEALFTIRISNNDNFEKISRTITDTLSHKLIPPAKNAPSPFKGGLIGFLTYETLGIFEKINLRPKEKSSVRESIFFAPTSFVAFNKTQKRAYLYSVSNHIPRSINILALPNSTNSPDADSHKLHATSNLTKKNFETLVRKVKNYIARGDIFQANIARRWRIQGISTSNKSIKAIPTDGKTIFLRLLKINPSPYACYLKFNDTEIISCSPELLVRRRDEIIETRPIAGTRPRGKTQNQDKNLSASLILSPKERAEHIMLVDLERNDLGKICLHGSVKVYKPMVIEKYSHVQHIVSYIRGKARKNLSPFDILKALFPGGTITGCPKIRSIQIIDEVEPVERGPYCGSLGWINCGKAPNDLEFNILIRTIIKTPSGLDFYAGAGIVADSKSAKEFEETRHKALAIAKTLGSKI